MTAIRKLALKISNAVVRYASPGSKEWAEGLAREIAFIESDWSALAWALGSTRVLFDYREAPIESLRDVPAAARKFVELTRSGVGLWIFIILGPLYARNLFYTTRLLERAGCVLVALSTISAGILMLMERRRLRNRQATILYDDAVACALLYKAELEHRSSYLLIFISTSFAWIVGVVLALRGGLYFHLYFATVLLGLIVAPLIVFLQRLNRRRIERLDALLSEKS